MGSNHWPCEYESHATTKLSYLDILVRVEGVEPTRYYYFASDSKSDMYYQFHHTPIITIIMFYFYKYIKFFT